MRPTARWLVFSLAFVSTFMASTNAGAQTFSLRAGSPTIPIAGPGCPPFSAFGDILVPGAPPVAFVPMGPPACGLGWPGPPGNVDAFSSGLTPIPPGPLPPGLVSFDVSVDGMASGDAGACTPLAPGVLPPDVGSEAAALSDAPADVFAVCHGGPGCPPAPPMPLFAPYTMPNFQLFDGNGIPVPPFAPAPPLGLLEPFPPGDDLDAFDAPPFPAWAGPIGNPVVPVYFSVDPPTAFGAGFLPSQVIVTVGGFLAGIYAPPPALGLDLIGGPGSDDLDALEVFDANGLPLTFTPGAGDVVLFSVAPGSAIIGTPNPCPGPLLGYPRGPGDILTEGTALGAPGAACVLVPAANMGLWSAAIGCPPNPFGAANDNIDALAITPPAAPPTTTTSTTTTSTTTTSTTTSTTTTSTTSTTTTTLIEHPQAAIKVILKENTATAKEKVVWVSKLPSIVLPGSDPTSVGATFRVKNPVSGETGTTALPSTNWATNPGATLYKFVNTSAPGGPSLVKVALIKSGSVLKVVAKDALISLDETTQGTIGVDLTVGSDRYCSLCSSPIKDEVGKYIAKGCSAPLACMFPSGAFLDD